MAEKCVSLGCPEYLRLAEQNACTGAPIRGASKGMIMRCTRNVTIEARVRDADTSEFVSDCGQVDEYVQDAYVQGYNISWETARLSPELHAMVLGHTLLTVGSTNVGFIEEAAVGCTTQATRPTFIVEAFYRIRQCDSSGGSTYLQRIIQGVRFNPVEQDKEGQIVFERYSGVSFPSLTAGLVNPTSLTAGPYQDVPDDIHDDLAALPASHLNVGLRFVTDLADPSAGHALIAGTCYTTTVPADVAP